MILSCFFDMILSCFFDINLRDFMKRKILYVSGTRADYGLMKKCLSLIDNSSNLDLEIAVCGMHLM